MRIPFLRGRSLASALAFAVMFATTALAFTPAAQAAGPTSLGVSGWQIDASTNIYANPYFGVFYHGDPLEYNAAPAIPAQNNPNWANCGVNSPTRGGVSMCPNASTIDMHVASILTNCWSQLNFTSFQALVSIPAGTSISQFSVNMNGADDGARISLVNSAYPNGVTPSDGYIWQQTQQSTGDLSSYVVAGEVNRVVITQVDDCPVGNNLNSAQISLNGAIIPVAPSANPVATPAANGAGWNNSNVNVNWNWTDSSSPIDPTNCTQSSTSSGEGTITLTSTCQTLSGIKASASYTVKVDTTPPAASPVATPAANGAGWNNSNVTVNWNWSDAGSGVDPNNCTQSSTSTGQGTLTLTSTCADIAGNSASASYTVKVDTTPPVVTFNGNLGTYTVAQTVAITCSAFDALSGVATSTCSNLSAPAWLLGLGSHSLTASATDVAGNVGTGSTKFTVTVDENSLCALVSQLTSNRGIANSLCVKLDAASAAQSRGQLGVKANDLSAFVHEVSAQSGKAFTAAQATLLVYFASQL